MVTVTMKGKGEIRGRVSDSGGAPLSDATVVCRGVRATSDAEGRYVLEGLREGTESVAVVFSRAGYRELVETTVVSGRVQLDATLNATMTCAVRLLWPALKDRPSAVFHVVLLTEQGRTMFRGRVVARRGATRVQAQAADLRSGQKVRVLCRDSLGDHVEAHGTMSGPEADGKLRLVVSLDTSLVATVTFLVDGEPAARHTVYVQSNDRREVWTSTDDSGRAALALVGTRDGEVVFWSAAGVSRPISRKLLGAGDLDVELGNNGAEVVLRSEKSEPLRDFDVRSHAPFSVTFTPRQVRDTSAYYLAPGRYFVAYKGKRVSDDIAVRKGQRVVLTVEDLVATGALMGNVASTPCRVRILETPTQRSRRVVASREVDRQFLFSELAAGEYLFEAAFAKRVLYRKVRVQAGHTVDLGLLEPAHASTLRVRVVKADGSPLANRSVRVLPLPRYTFPSRAIVTDGDGVCVVSREAHEPIQLSYERGYALVRAGSADEVSIQLPDMRPHGELRLSKDREPPSQVFWVAASPTAAWFYLLQPLGGSRFSLPRCTGTQTLVLTGDTRGYLVVTAQRDESGAFIESAATRVPVKTQGAWSYELQYTEIAGVACAPLKLGRRGRCMGSSTSHFLLGSGVKARVRFADQNGTTVFERNVP